MNKEIHSYISQGNLYVRLIIEILGKPKDYLEKIMRKTLDMLYSYEGVLKKISEKVEPPELAKTTPLDHNISSNDNSATKELYHTFAEVELIIKDIVSLSKICLEFTPSSIEIIEPEHITLTNHQLNTFFNDLSYKLSNFILSSKDNEAKNILLLKNFKKLVKNFIYFSLLSGDKTLEQLSKITGLDQAFLESIINEKIKEGRIIKHDGAFSLVR